MGYTSELQGYNYNRRCCYPRRMADSNRNAMLFSSGDSPKPSAILSGEGLDEGNEESRRNRTGSFTCGSQQMNTYLCQVLSFTFFPILLHP
jgi:hypothetical protein